MKLEMVSSISTNSEVEMITSKEKSLNKRTREQATALSMCMSCLEQSKKIRRLDSTSIQSDLVFRIASAAGNCTSIPLRLRNIGSTGFSKSRVSMIRLTSIDSTQKT